MLPHSISNAGPCKSRLILVVAMSRSGEDETVSVILKSIAQSKTDIDKSFRRFDKMQKLFVTQRRAVHRAVSVRTTSKAERSSLLAMLSATPTVEGGDCLDSQSLLQNLMLDKSSQYYQDAVEILQSRELLPLPTLH